MLATLKTETPRLLACCKRHLKIGSNCPPQQQQWEKQNSCLKGGNKVCPKTKNKAKKKLQEQQHK